MASTVGDFEMLQWYACIEDQCSRKWPPCVNPIMKTFNFFNTPGHGTLEVLL